jgi:hypothetical protein
MAMTTYGRSFYSALIVGKETAPVDLYLALCNAMPTDASTGATISEGPATRPLVSGGVQSALWGVPVDGVSTYGGTLTITATENDNWGTIVGYALCDTAAAGTGNVLFYGSVPSFTVNAALMYLDIQGIQVAVV